MSIEAGVTKTLDCMGKKPKGPGSPDGFGSFDGINLPGGPGGFGGPGLPGGPGGFGGPGFKWPGINEPGFATLIAGCLGASFAGIGILTDFIPIKLDNNGLPKLPDLPGIDIFVKGFTGSAVGLPSLKAASIPVPGIGSIPLPDIKGFDIPDISAKRLDGSTLSLPGFDPSMILKMIGLFIGAPFLIIKGIIETIPSLSIGIPDIPSIFFSAGASMGIPSESLNICIPCLAKSILELIKSILPI